MSRAKRKWRVGVGLSVAMVALVAFLWWSNSRGVGRYTSSRRMVHNANYKMNVTFFAYDEGGNATDEVVSSGTIAFSKASFGLDAFEAQWRLRVPQSARTGPLAESGCLELLNGPGVLDAIQGNEYWWLDFQPHMADYNIVVTLDSFSEEFWSGEWLFTSEFGAPRIGGTFEAVKPGG